MKLPEFLIDHPDGEIRLSGHRIGLYDVVARYQEGTTPEGLHEDFPDLPPSLIQNTLDFYSQNRIEVDEYVAAYRAELDRQRATTPRVGPSFSELRRRAESMRRGQVR